MAHVSGDRLLVLTDSVDYHPWGYLGPALLLDLHNGRLVAELRGERGAPMGNGRFLVGLQGYDVFDTWLHDRDGTLLTSWRSFGYYIPDPDSTVRVIEQPNRTPPSTHVVRLLPDGGIERGPSLSAGRPPTPVVLADGTAMVLDQGVLRAFDWSLRGEEVARLLSVEPNKLHLFPSRVRLEGDRLTVTVTELRNLAQVQAVEPVQAVERNQWTFACQQAGR
ncbi:hypothetical protein F4561_003185 [Lipingzhangella halophila]|uniref:Uncharacterized protein n=1 Tax=Lipingzhangella halophila TaxID=1783352 RepID=A0A7W7RI27_9ACTN|nr:hypothetical protein [Lipingzhangella halophila]MBB4932365.1 hypothetical protein [Lipingzhangella halophila]